MKIGLPNYYRWSTSAKSVNVYICKQHCSREQCTMKHVRWYFVRITQETTLSLIKDTACFINMPARKTGNRNTQCKHETANRTAVIPWNAWGLKTGNCPFSVTKHVNTCWSLSSHMQTICSSLLYARYGNLCTHAYLQPPTHPIREPRFTRDDPVDVAHACTPGRQLGSLVACQWAASISGHAHWYGPWGPRRIDRVVFKS